MPTLPGKTGLFGPHVVVFMERDVQVERIGPDPFGRGEPTVFYRDYRVDGGGEVFYLWANQWAQTFPDVPLPPVPTRVGRVR